MRRNRIMAALMMVAILVSSLFVGCNKKNPTPVKNVDNSIATDYPMVVFGEKTVSKGMKCTIDSKKTIKNNSIIGKEYVKVEPNMILNFKLNDNYAKKLSGKKLFVRFEYYESSSKNFVVSYKDKSGQKNLTLEMLGSSNWSGIAVKVDSMKLDTEAKSHFSLKLDTATSMWLRSVSIIEDNTKEQKYPQIIKSDYETSNGKIIESNVKDFGAIGDGKIDDSLAFQTALRSMKEKGGVLYVPAGTYKLTQDIIIPSGVTLLGDFNAPTIDNPKANGTIIAAYVPSIADGNKSLFMCMEQGSCAKGLTIWYPEQTLATGEAEPYNYTIGISGAIGVSIEDIYLVNSYNGITHASYDKGHYQQMVKNIYGTPLYCGHITGYATDSDRHQNINFSPDYWLGSGLENIPDEKVLKNWLINYAVGLNVGNIDFHYISDVNIDGYKIGLYVWEFYGRFYNLNITNCNVCMYVEGTALYGGQITKSVFKADGGKNPVGLLIGEGAANGFTGTLLDISSTGKYAVSHLGTGAMAITDSKISVAGKNSVSPLYVSDGQVSIMNTEFSGGETHAAFANGADESGLFNCTASSGEFKLDDKTDNLIVFKTDEGNKAPLAADVLDVADSKRAYQKKKPTKQDLFNLSDYGIPDGERPEIGATLQKAIDAASNNGGGYVYIPAGVYRLETPVVVKSGVEIVGTSDYFHYIFSGIPTSTILTDYGKGGVKEPLIKLQENSGVRGLSIVYDVVSQETIQKHTPTIQATGKDCYTINTSIVGAWDAVDYNTYKCDDLYLESVNFFAFNRGIAIGGGSKGGVVLNAHSNPGELWSTGFNLNKWDSSWTGPLLTHQHENAIHYYYGDCTDQVLFMTGTFGANKALMLDGADVVIVGLGTDYSVNDVYITGDSNVNLFDLQCIGSYQTSPYTSTAIVCDEKFTGIANVYNLCPWNIKDTAIRIDGGTFSVNGGYFLHSGQSAIIATGGDITMRGVVVVNRSGGDLQALKGTKSVTAYGNIIYGTPTYIIDSSVKSNGSDIK